VTEEQFAFDIEGMLHEAAVESAPEWHGAPLHFTTAYYPPAEFDAALDHWMFLHAHDNTHVNSRMWRQSITVPDNTQVKRHGFALYTTDLRCEPWKHSDRHESCLCVGDLMYQAICEPCEWNVITDHENAAVELWHDHALPGWRELPIVPSRLRMMDKGRMSMSTKKWIDEHYPKSMQVPGAPMITERRPFGTRHVPGRSPWGGYDISHTAVDPDHIVEGAKPIRRTPDLALEPRRTATSSSIGLGD
jgi:hypothetical protein